MSNVSVPPSAWLAVLVLVCLSCIGAGCGDKSASASSGVSEDIVSTYVVDPDGQLAGLSPEEIRRRIESTAVRSYWDMMNLGAVHTVLDDFSKAAECYNGAAEAAGDDMEKALALQARGFVRAFTEGELAGAVGDLRRAVRLAPESLDIARTWHALAALAQDGVDRQAAALHLGQLDPTGSPVAMDPVLGSVLIVGMLCATAVTLTALTPPEDRAEVAKSVMASICASGWVGVDSLRSGSTTAVPAIGSFVSRAAFAQ